MRDCQYPLYVARRPPWPTRRRHARARSLRGPCRLFFNRRRPGASSASRSAPSCFFCPSPPRAFLSSAESRPSAHQSRALARRRASVRVVAFALVLVLVLVAGAQAHCVSSLGPASCEPGKRVSCGGCQRAQRPSRKVALAVTHGQASCAAGQEEDPTLAVKASSALRCASHLPLPGLSGSLGAAIERFNPRQVTFHAPKSRAPSHRSTHNCQSHAGEALTTRSSWRGETGAPDADEASCERFILLWTL